MPNLLDVKQGDGEKSLLVMQPIINEGETSLNHENKESEEHK
jgi:hypothetical protein